MTDVDELEARARRLAAALWAWTDGRWDPALTPALVGELRIVARRIEDASERVFDLAIRREVSGH